MPGLTLAKSQPAAPPGARVKRSRGEEEPDEERHVVPEGLIKDSALRKLLVAMIKQLLQNTQQMRDVFSVVFDTLLLPTESTPVTMAKAQNVLYQSETKNKKKHGLGSPHIYTVGGAMEALLKLAADHQDKEVSNQMEPVFKEYGDLEPKQKEEICLFFRLTQCHDTNQSRILMAFSSDLPGQALRKTMIKSLEVLAAAEIKTGRAPAGWMERDLQQWLQQLAPPRK
jgi:hypothetical protein